MLAGVLLNELVFTGICAVTVCCRSGLFLVGEARPIEMGSGAPLFRGVSVGVELVSGCVSGGIVGVLAMSGSLVIMLGNSNG